MESRNDTGTSTPTPADSTPADSTQWPREPLVTPGVQVPALPVRARRGLLRLVLRRAMPAGVVAVAALVVSYHYGGFLGSGRYQELHEVLAICGAVVFLVSAVIAVRSGTNDVIGLVHVPGRLGDARAATFRLICLLFGYVVVVLCALSLLHVPVAHLLLGGVLTGGDSGYRGAAGTGESLRRGYAALRQAVRDRRRADDPPRCPRRPDYRPSHRDDPHLRQDTDEGGAGAAAQRRGARSGRRTGHRLAGCVASAEVVTRV
jgi:hypothetical protein